MYLLPNSLADDTGAPEAFLPGDLIRHKRYQYRGVVVSVDSECLAEDGWYYSNKTQPAKKQPWYHVLVDNTTGTTYTAHSSIEIDPLKEPVSHPLTLEFFERFEDGHYVRNDQSWPS